MATLAVLFLAWYLIEILLLVFGGILLAILLRSAAFPITRIAMLPLSASIAIVFPSDSKTGR